MKFLDLLNILDSNTMVMFIYNDCMYQELCTSLMEFYPELMNKDVHKVSVVDRSLILIRF